MAGTTTPENLTTVGIEIETEFIPQGMSPPLDSFRTTHDASIESNVPYISFRGKRDDFIFYGEIPEKIRNLFGAGFLNLGVEYYSEILNPNIVDIEKLLEKNIDSLYLSGEESGIRSGIHFHVSLSSPPCYVLKNLVRIFLRYEDLIFKLSGLGKVNRGIFNSSAYSRPLSSGLYVPCGGIYYPIVNYDDLFKTRTSREFFDVWGDSNNMSGSRYFPARYLVLNLAPILFRGAVEFRPCNTTLNYKWIWGIMEFFRKLTKLSYSDRANNIEQVTKPVSEKRELVDLHDDLVQLSKLMFLDDKVFYTVEDIFNKTPTTKIPHEILRCHLESRRERVQNHWHNCNTYSPKEETGLNYIPNFPKIDDIHARGG